MSKLAVVHFAPLPIHQAIYTLVELWKRDPAAAYAIADASRLSAQKETMK